MLLVEGVPGRYAPPNTHSPPFSWRVGVSVHCRQFKSWSFRPFDIHVMDGGLSLGINCLTERCSSLLLGLRLAATLALKGKHGDAFWGKHDQEPCRHPVGEAVTRVSSL